MRRLLVTAIVVFATACRTLPFADPHLEGEYGKALKKWTRTVALYNGLETRAFVRIVFLSPEFVEAQARELSKMRAELPDQAAETLARLREEYKQPSFFAIVYMPDRGANDWNQPASVWRLALNLGLGERAADRVVRYETPFNAGQRALFPYLDEYSTAYLLRFPEASPPQLQTNATTAQTPPPPPVPKDFTPTEATLVVAGALGKMKFHWSLDGGPEEPTQAETGSEEHPAPPAKP